MGSRGAKSLSRSTVPAVVVSAITETGRDRIARVAATHGHHAEVVEPLPDVISATAAEHAPACVVLACKRPDRHALSWIKAVEDELDGSWVILVCEEFNNYQLRRALDNGASGMVLADELDRALSPAIMVVSAGQICVPAERGEQLRPKVLTTREKQILGLVVMGLSNSEIATKLFVAESTVKSHLSSSFAKMGVGSRHEAASLILDPVRGSGLGILSISSDRPRSIA